MGDAAPPDGHCRPETAARSVKGMASDGPTGDDEGLVLFVCEGNVARSAFAEAVMASRLSGLGVAVASAGTRAVVDADLDPLARTAAERLEGEVAPFRARQLVTELIEPAGVVLCATRAQRDDVARLSPRAMSRTFALRDFGTLLAHWDGHTVSGDVDAPLVTLLVRVAAAERGLVPWMSADAVDVADPYGRGAAAFDRMREQMLPSLQQIEDALIALRELRGSHPGAPRAPRP